MAACRDLRKCPGGVGHSFNRSRVGRGSDDYEIVIHHIPPTDAEARRNKPVFRFPSMHEYDIAIAVSAVFQRLAGSDSHDTNIDPGPVAEQRDQTIQQTGFWVEVVD